MPSESGKPDQTTDFAEAFGLPGGPAYPISIPGSGDNGAHGMSLRDWFAGLAMMAGLGKAFTGAAGDTYDERVAKAAYGMADTMLKARRAE